MMELFKHYVYLIFYILFLIASCLNITFPIYFLKSLEIFNKKFMEKLTKLLQHNLIILQAGLTALLITIGDTDIWIYKNKIKLEKGKYDDKDEEIEFNLEFPDNKSIVTLPNHVSQIDPLYIGVLFDCIYPQKSFNNFQDIIFSKNDVRFYPLIGWFLLANDGIFVLNDKKNTHINQVPYITNKLKKGHNKRNYLIFMEGNTFSEKEKIKREKRKPLHYDNILIPRTKGLHLIQSNCDIDSQYYVSIKYEHPINKDWSYGIRKILKGIKPKSVHIHIEKKKTIKNINDKNKFDENVYNDFRLIDNKLSLGIDEWKNLYDYKKVSLNFINIMCLICNISLVVITICSFFLFKWIYLTYITFVTSFFIFKAFKEHTFGFDGKNIKIE